MIQPPPSKFVCPKCGYSKIHQLQSDALNLTDLVQICPKCGEFMKTKGLVTIQDRLATLMKAGTTSVEEAIRIGIY